MVYKCCVPQCRGNYPGGPKVHVFKFPEDEAKKNAWLNAIPREHFLPTKYSRVCEVHFKSGEVLWESSHFDEKSGRTLTAPLDRPRLKYDAVPSVFPGCPTYLSSQSQSLRESPQKKRQRLEAAAVERATAESLQTYADFENTHNFSNFEELVILAKQYRCSNFWDVVYHADALAYIRIELDNVATLVYCVTIKRDLTMTCCSKGVELQSLLQFTFPKKITNINQLTDVLCAIESLDHGQCSDNQKFSIVKSFLDSISSSGHEHQNFINFFSFQLELIQQPKHAFRYNSDLLVFASLVFIISPHAYRFIRSYGNIILPHPNTIHRLCTSFNFGPESEQMEENFLFYMKSKVGQLTLNECHVVLMVDEIHIKPFMDYKGGIIVGSGHDSDKVASSAHVFMVQSLFSGYKDVVHILPVSSLTGEILHGVLKKIIVRLEKLGLRVVCVVTDNNSINRKAMAQFSFPHKLSIVYNHPCDSSRPLFFMIDVVHILKCVRNNWLNQRNQGLKITFPGFDVSSEGLNTASFETLRELYQLESDKLLKFGYGLSLKALWPSNLERQNVKPVLQVFSEYVIEALNEFGKKCNLVYCESTANFIEIILTWWKIVNVKTPYKGTRLKDPMQEPLRSTNDERASFLRKVLSWLDRWESMSLTSGTLSRETHAALKHSTYALLEVTDYCISELNMSYVLTGKFQTDVLEARFGLYRQLAGCQYNVSVRQVFEVEKKLRMSSIMQQKLQSLVSSSETSVDILNCELSEGNMNDAKPFLGIKVEDCDLLAVNEDIPVITYLAGYCAYAAIKKLKCEFCKNFLVTEKSLDNEFAYSLTSNLDRGGLLYPQEFVIKVVTFTYIVVNKLTSKTYENQFLKTRNQRHVVISVTHLNLEAQECAVWDACENGHKSQRVLQLILMTSANALLNNYCKNKNNDIKSKANIRILQTLQKH